MDTLALSTRVKERKSTYYLPLRLCDIVLISQTEDENFQLYGTSVELVEVVCLVLDMRQVPMKSVLELQDCTGKFLGVVYTRSEIQVPAALKGFSKEEGYASIFGRLIKFADEPVISIMKARNVDYSEVMAFRARAAHTLCSLSRLRKAQGNEQLQAQVLQMLSPAGVPLTVLAEKLKLPQDVLRCEVFVLLEQGTVTIKNNRVYKTNA